MFDNIYEECTKQWHIQRANKDWLPTALTTYWDESRFTDRISYLEWVCRWKETYKKLSQDSRSCKLAIRTGQREGKITWQEQGHREALRFFAICLLILRAEGKCRSWKMKQEAKQLVS